MFSSNQVFQISGCMRQLEEALRFALSFSEKSHSKIVFQTTDDGKYCIGWKGDSDIKGWQQYQFDFDASIVAKIIVQFLCKQDEKKSGYEYADGSTGDGFIMRNIPETFSDVWAKIKNPFYGIVYFERWCNFYSK